MIEIKPSISSSKNIILPRYLMKMHVLSDELRILLKEISREKMSRNLNVFTRAPGNFPSKQGDREKKGVSQSCLTFCDPMICSLSGSSVHGILQARILEWVAISFSRGSS